MRNNRCRFTEGYLLAVLKFPADTAIRGRLPLFQRNIRCRGGGRISSAVKGILRQRLTALRLARLRRSRPRFARHLAAPRPLHAALPCGGDRPQSSLALAPTAVNGAYLFINRKLKQSLFVCQDTAAVLRRIWYVDIFIGYTFHTQIMYFYYRMRIIPFFKGSGIVCGCFISTVW